MTGEWAAACAAGHAARSMSRKARSPDNARREGLFGTLKSDFFVFANVGVDGTLSRFSTLRSWAC